MIDYINYRIIWQSISAYGKMTLPVGVKAEAYVIWDNKSFYAPL